MYLILQCNNGAIGVGEGHTVCRSIFNFHSWKVIDYCGGALTRWCDAVQ